MARAEDLARALSAVEPGHRPNVNGSAPDSASSSRAGGSAPPSSSRPSVTSHERGVSRTTVVRAYNELKASGHLDSLVGSGTYVRRMRRDQNARMLNLVEPGHRFEANPAHPRAGTQSMINLSNSVPEPLPELAEAIHAVADDAVALSSSATHHTPGDPALRGWVADWYSQRGLPTDPSQVLITSGAQQALTMSCQLLLRREAYLMVERPTYLGILDIARNRNTHLLSVPELDDTASLEPLREALNQQRTAVLYSMSTCHTITGTVLSAQRKREIRVAAGESGSFIIDDDILANQTFAGEQSAPIAAYGSDATVITVGGTSKLLWDGLRVGWIRAPHAMIGSLIRIKSAADLETSVLAQLVSLRLLREEPRFARRRVAEARAKLAETEALLADRLPDWQVNVPDGGRSMWIRLPAGTNAARFASAAVEHGVAIPGGDTFTSDGSFSDYLRLGFVHATICWSRGSIGSPTPGPATTRDDPAFG